MMKHQKLIARHRNTQEWQKMAFLQGFSCSILSHSQPWLTKMAVRILNVNRFSIFFHILNQNNILHQSRTVLGFYKLQSTSYSMVISDFYIFHGGHLENRPLRPLEGSKVKKNFMNELPSSIRTFWCVTHIPLDCIAEFLFFDPLVFDDFQKRGRQKFRPHF